MEGAAEFARCVNALRPWLGDLVFAGGWAHRLHRDHALARSPTGPRDLAYREVLGGRVVHERRFDVVRLWEMDPRRAVRLGPGMAALIGLAEKVTLPSTIPPSPHA